MFYRTDSNSGPVRITVKTSRGFWFWLRSRDVWDNSIFGPTKFRVSGTINSFTWGDNFWDDSQTGNGHSLTSKAIHFKILKGGQTLREFDIDESKKGKLVTQTFSWVVGMLDGSDFNFVVLASPKPVMHNFTDISDTQKKLSR